MKYENHDIINTEMLIARAHQMRADFLRNSIRRAFSKIFRARRSAPTAVAA